MSTGPAAPAGGPVPADAPSRGPAHVRVVRGAPDDDELAALVAGLVAAASDPSDAAAPDSTPSTAWTDRARVLRGSVAPAAGQDSWRWSLRG